jgi:hypothetical protein
MLRMIATPLPTQLKAQLLKDAADGSLAKAMEGGKEALSLRLWDDSRVNDEQANYVNAFSFKGTFTEVNPP